MTDTPAQQQSAPEPTNDLGQQLFPDTLVMVACNQCATARLWPLNCRHDYAKIYTQDYTRVRADVAQTVDGISWSALLSALERLRSKNRNPDNEWYHGWNAAIQCLINDINSRSATASAVTPTVGHLLRDAGVILIPNGGNDGARVVIRFSELRDAERLHNALLQVRAAWTTENTAATTPSTVDEAARYAAKEIIIYLRPYDLKWGVTDLADEVSKIIAKHVGPEEDAEDDNA